MIQQNQYNIINLSALSNTNTNYNWTRRLSNSGSVNILFQGSIFNPDDTYTPITNVNSRVRINMGGRQDATMDLDSSNLLSGIERNNVVVRFTGIRLNLAADTGLGSDPNDPIHNNSILNAHFRTTGRSHITFQNSLIAGSIGGARLIYSLRGIATLVGQNASVNISTRIVANEINVRHPIEILRNGIVARGFTT